MVRTPQPFEVYTEIDDDRPQHVHAKLIGDLDGRPEVAQELERFTKTIADGSKTAVVVHASQSRLTSEGAERWMAFVDALPASIQLVYADAQLSMVMRDEDYARRFPNHIHVTLPYIDMD